MYNVYIYICIHTYMQEYYIYIYYIIYRHASLAHRLRYASRWKTTFGLFRTASLFNGEAFRRFDQDNSGKIDVLEMVGMCLGRLGPSNGSHFDRNSDRNGTDGCCDILCDLSKFLARSRSLICLAWALLTGGLLWTPFERCEAEWTKWWMNSGGHSTFDILKCTWL
jgi:hypothetical protein